jgi:hypothetical protein
VKRLLLIALLACGCGGTTVVHESGVNVVADTPAATPEPAAPRPDGSVRK